MNKKERVQRLWLSGCDHTGAKEPNIGEKLREKEKQKRSVLGMIPNKKKEGKRKYCLTMGGQGQTGVALEKVTHPYKTASVNMNPGAKTHNVDSTKGLVKLFNTFR